MNLHFTKYRISTITSNAKILLKDKDDRIDINLISLFNNININNNDESECYVYTSRFENKSSVDKIERGIYIKKKELHNIKEHLIIRFLLYINLQIITMLM